MLILKLHFFEGLPASPPQIGKSFLLVWRALGFVRELAREISSQSRGEDFRAFWIEVDVIGLVILMRQYGGIHRNERFHPRS